MGNSNLRPLRLETPLVDRGTNGNRVRRKHVCLEYLDTRNVNLRSFYLKIPLVDREPMEIEFAGNLFSWGISVREG